MKIYRSSRCVPGVSRRSPDRLLLLLSRDGRDSENHPGCSVGLALSPPNCSFVPVDGISDAQSITAVHSLQEIFFILSRSGLCRKKLDHLRLHTNVVAKPIDPFDAGLSTKPGYLPLGVMTHVELCLFEGA